MKERIARALAAVLTVACLLPMPVRGLSAQKAIVMDALSGAVLFERNADRRSLIASTTKIMTALLICEQCSVLEQLRVPQEATGIEGSSMYLQPGEVLTVQELLYGLMLSSGNDAAVALALYCDGSVEAFADRMNDKARLLGMTGSHFENPNGLDSPNHYSTARDLARLASYAMENPIFAKTVSTKSIAVGERFLRNHNKLLWQLPGADGVKTGYTRAAGRILVSSATRNGRRLVAVTIDDPDDWADHKALLTQGFSQYAEKKLISQGQAVGELPVAGGIRETVQLLAGEDVSLWLRPGEHPGVVRSAKGFAYAPVVEGADAGHVYLVLNGKAVAKIPVVYGKTVEQLEPKRPWWRHLLGCGH